MAKVNIEIIGVPEVKRYMEQKQAKIKNKIPEALRDGTLYLHGKIKESIARGTNAPVAVDTGRFLNSIDFEMEDETTSKVFTELSYAKFIEYGTSRMKRRPHFRNTAAVEKKNVLTKFGNKLNV
jgi:HK97 gp10 family phage protein